MIDREQLLSAGFSSEAADRAQAALQANDLRGFLHELLLRGLWSDVVDEAQPEPLWIARWRDLAAGGFPLIDACALQRLLDAGVDLHDLTGVVRSAQVLAITNIAELLDYPAIALGRSLPAEVTPHLAFGREDAEGTQRLHALRPEVLCRDPSGRYGEPRPLALLHWQALPEDVREQIKSMVQDGKRAPAAAMWKQHMGGELRVALEAMETLRGVWKEID